VKKECAFEDLPEKLRKVVASMKECAVPLEIIRCTSDQNKENARCIVQDGTVFGIFDLSRKRVATTWIGSHEVMMLANAIESTRP